jgi:putative spermidine/putrescine transport system ATP-binding protein
MLCCVRNPHANTCLALRKICGKAGVIASVTCRGTGARIMPAVLKLSDVTKTYGGLKALDGIDLVLPDNSYVSLLGPSGSGKTTLLRVIAGFEMPDRGSVIFKGTRIETVPPHRRDIGFVFQNFALFPHLSVAQNIAFGLENRDVNPVAGPKVKARVKDIVSLVGLSGLEDRGVTQISGGQRQRVALARTLITEPSLVLLDEPLGALDANLRMRMRSELRSIRERCGVTFLHVTGGESEALAMGDTVLVLDRGRIVQADGSDTVYNQPSSPAVARFLNCYNVFEGSIDGSSFVCRSGRFAIGTETPRKSSHPAYAIRYDRVSVRPGDAVAADDEVRIDGTFVASEYSGSAINSFFALDDGRVFEVEAHLSRSVPETYAEHGRYALVWKREDALVYA